MKRLHVTHCTSLALSCKHLGRIAMESQTLELDETEGWSLVEFYKTADFFSMLQRSWVPKVVERCDNCGKFQSTDQEYWKDYKMRRQSPKLFTGSEILRFWASGRNDHNVKFWCKYRVGTCPVCSAVKDAQGSFPNTISLLEWLCDFGDLLEGKRMKEQCLKSIWCVSMLENIWLEVRRKIPTGFIQIPPCLQSQ